MTDPRRAPVPGLLPRRKAVTGLTAGAGALAAAAASGCSGYAAAAPTPPLSVGRTGTRTEDPAPGVMQLFTDASMNYRALLALGAAQQSAAETGEVLTAVNAVNSEGVGFQTYSATFRSWGERLEAQATAAGRAGRKETRRLRALRSATYYDQALFHVLGSDKPDDEESVYRACRRQWDTFARLCTPAAEFGTVQYGKERLPIWFFRPGTSRRRRPTVILTNGDDGQEVRMWTYGVAAALRRDWNALVYDGPGQGQMLFSRRVPLTPRWELVVAPLVDRLVLREDVDPRRIALVGVGLGGLLAARAAAFERRLAALVAGPGVLSPWRTLPAKIRAVLNTTKAGTNRTWNERIVPELTAGERFVLSKRFEPYDPAVMLAARAGKTFTDFWSPARVLSAMDVTGVVRLITAPSLVVDFDDEQFFPGQPRRMYDRLRSAKDYVKLSRADGAQLHCSPMAPQRYCEVVFDWLEETV